jgi:cell division protein FtsI/penicillin-binding protein 2
MMYGTMTKRLLRVMLLMAVGFGLTEARLAWIQLGLSAAPSREASLAERSTAQRTDQMVLDSGRGNFVDRYGRPITGETVQALVAFPQNGMPRGTEEAVGRLAAILHAPRDELKVWLDEVREPAAWQGKSPLPAAALSREQAAQIAKLRLSGVRVLPYTIRYPAGLRPLHLIGYISQNPKLLRARYASRLADGRLRPTTPVGGEGLEAALDRFLQGAGATEAVMTTDAARRPLEGLGLRVRAPSNAHYPVRVTTTLDLDLQREAEAALDEAGVQAGAIVVLDTHNADILAMASLPRLAPYRIGAAGTDERNHALAAYPPGSVFKTVTLAAAWESGVLGAREKFRCSGHYGRYGLQCWREEGHGILTWKQAYAESCNVVFAALAERLDPAELQRTAERLGFGRQVGWSDRRFLDGKPLRLLPEEEAGAIFADPERGRDGGVRTGTGIGQRDVRVTPLQAANLAVTLLHDGKVLAPRAVREIRYADGSLLAKLPSREAPSPYGRIRPETARMLREAMTAVVTEGTARQALQKAEWPLAGKSGTAEAAPGRNDHWFVGYGPNHGTPRYAAAVLLEDQPAGLRNRAALVFGDLMNRIRAVEQSRLRGSADGR